MSLELYSTTWFIYSYDKTDRRSVSYVNNETHLSLLPIDNKKRTGYYDFIGAPKMNQHRGNTFPPLNISLYYNNPVIHE